METSLGATERVGTRKLSGSFVIDLTSLIISIIAVLLILISTNSRGMRFVKFQVQSYNKHLFRDILAQTTSKLSI